MEKKKIENTITRLFLKPGLNFFWLNRSFTFFRINKTPIPKKKSKRKDNGKNVPLKICAGGDKLGGENNNG